MSWESELVGLLAVSKKPGRADLTDNEETVDAMSHSEGNATASLRDLNVDLLSDEIRRRVQECGGGPILDLRVKGWTIRVQMDMGRFKKFKKKAADDPVLKHFEFTHRKPKKKGGG
jgi:hypothetical protein